MSNEPNHMYATGHIAAIVDRERLEGEVKQLRADLAAARADAERLRGAMRKSLDEWNAGGRAIDFVSSVEAAFYATPATGQGAALPAGCPETTTRLSDAAFECPPSLTLTIGDASYEYTLTDAGYKPVDPCSGAPSLVESFEALREAGGKAWDKIADPAAYLGRESDDEPEPGECRHMPAPVWAPRRCGKCGAGLGGSNDG